MKKGVSVVAAIVAIGSVAGWSSVVLAQKAPSLPTRVISPLKAMSLASVKVKGQALSCTFEMDEGHWIYGVVVVSGKTLQEVELDPSTGKIGDVEKITPEGEAKEMAASLNKAIGRPTKQSQ